LTAVSINPGWATYLRVSDEDKQTPERSFAMQRQRIQEQLLAASGVSLIREYTDLLSGTKPNRKDYQQMLADAAAGKFSHLGLYRADRFGRNTVEGLQAATKLMGFGVKIRIANMPGLQPENPDGYFLFLLQMGLAQREVDVLAQRTADGMEAKLRKGGWAHKAPEGYVNKERHISNKKYERWVEQDPEGIKGIKLAWELLLTDRYTLRQICEELAKQGFARASGLPWAWDDPKNGGRKTALNALYNHFCNPFYAGWVTSKRFGIRIGEVSGNWEPIITDDQFESGKAILAKHGSNKSKPQKKHYLLRSLLWVDTGKKKLKMYGSTPTGSKCSISYYRTHVNVNGKRLRLSTPLVDDQVTVLINHIAIEPDFMQEIRDAYQADIKKKTQDDKSGNLENLRKRLASLENEEARLARLFMAGKINEATYDQLRDEWREKTRNIQVLVKELELDSQKHLDNLELGIVLLSNVSNLFSRLKENERTVLLQVLIKRIIIDCEGQIISFDLHSPFTYLTALAARLKNNGSREGGRSTVLRLGTPTATRTQVFGSGGQRSIH
jgi:DNA invertase Pin-like site-specific DNA recombinase